MSISPAVRLGRGEPQGDVGVQRDVGRQLAQLGERLVAATLRIEREREHDAHVAATRRRREGHPRIALRRGRLAGVDGRRGAQRGDAGARVAEGPQPRERLAGLALAPSQPARVGPRRARASWSLGSGPPTWPSGSDEAEPLGAR